MPVFEIGIESFTIVSSMNCNRDLKINDERRFKMEASQLSFLYLLIKFSSLMLVDLTGNSSGFSFSSSLSETFDVDGKDSLSSVSEPESSSSVNCWRLSLSHISNRTIFGLNIVVDVRIILFNQSFKDLPHFSIIIEQKISQKLYRVVRPNDHHFCQCFGQRYADRPRQKLTIFRRRPRRRPLCYRPNFRRRFFGVGANAQKIFVKNGRQRRRHGRRAQTSAQTLSVNAAADDVVTVNGDGCNAVARFDVDDGDSVRVQLEAKNY
uniref:Uncharacterized protein n=1 Tax=Romanomermis culicivorax TaxID=13658 RepID=A0A915JHP7_ROMCU